MKTYLDLLQKVLDEGEVREDRTGVGTRSIFGAQARYDLRKNFPLLTTKKCHLRSIIHELLWFRLEAPIVTLHIHRDRKRCRHLDKN